MREDESGGGWVDANSDLQMGARMGTAAAADDDGVMVEAVPGFARGIVVLKAGDAVGDDTLRIVDAVEMAAEIDEGFCTCGG